MDTTRRILVIEDHPIMREALEQIIAQQPDLEICGSAEGRAAAREVLASVVPDLAVVDLTLKDCSGTELVAELHQRLPDLPILVLSMHDETLFAVPSRQAGARGYLMKEVASEQLIEAIRELLAGGEYFSEDIRNRLRPEESAGG